MGDLRVGENPAESSVTETRTGHYEKSTIVEEFEK